MARRTLAFIRARGHEPSFSRAKAGYSPFGRPVYANTVKCECGWKWGGQWAPKSDAIVAHNDHLREVGAGTYKPETEMVWVGNLTTGDRLVRHLSGAGITEYPSIIDIGVDGGYIHVRFDHGLPMTFFKGDRVRRVVRP